MSTVDVLKQFHSEVWQLIPYDDCPQYLHRFKVGEAALVTSRKSDLYRKKVLVCNMKDSGVNVVGPGMVTAVGQNLWLLTALIELHCSRICSCPSWSS